MISNVQTPIETPVPKVTACNVRALVAALKRIGHWIKGDALKVEMGDTSAGWERKVRRIASVARPVVISYPGAPGYLHADFVTREELDHCIAAYRAVAKDATCTANLYQHLYNQKFGGGTPDPIQETLALSV